MSEGVPTPAQIEDKEIDLALTNSIQLQIAELPDEIKRLLKKISYLVARVGMSLEEACILCDTTQEQLTSLTTQYPVIATVLQKKKLELKKDMLKIVGDRARGGDGKLAWEVLEANFPDEFGNKKRRGTEDNNALTAALEHIRESDSQGHVKETRKVFITQGGKEKAEPKKKLNPADVLS